MDTSSNDSVLPTPIDPKFPAHAAEPQIVEAAEPNPGSPLQGDTSSTLDRILRLPSSVTLLTDSWNPPSPFVYHDQSPAQGSTRPIACRKPADQAEPRPSPTIHSLRHMSSSVSLFADAWNPPSQFVYEYQPPSMGGTRPIVPRNKRRDFQAPGDLVPIPSAPTQDTVSVAGKKLPARSARRHAMIFEPEKPIDRLVSTLRNSALTPRTGGFPDF
ncbi:hypothetical protein FRC08_005342 [Ceratobasidium sp. 394]|nr:hypothetical protein FRC08_005342 [Ceratobasidium sp. 394]